MAWPTDRILVYDRTLSFLFELTTDEVTKRERTEELNGTHELELVTSRVLHEGYRLLTVDNTGKWREHVVYKPDEGHEKGKHATGTYMCMWSLQYDLTSTVEGNVAQPGMGSACSSKNAVTAAIGGQSIWAAGECDVPAVAAGKGCVMVGNNAWNRLKQVVATWGGEVDAEITVSSTKVVTRKVVLRAHLGSTKAVRRFDWGEDLTKIHRIADPGPYFCRILPFGRGQREYAEDDETEFDWPSDVTEEPYSEGDGWVHDNGSAFVRDPEAEAVFRTADGHGGWHYPTKEVKYDEDDPELLLNEATADIHNHTRPSVSYEADVLQFAEAGMDAQGVALGDDVQCVDYGFNPDAALRVQGRVTRMVVNELAPKTDTKLTIGDLGTTLATTLKDLIGSTTQGITQRLNHIEGGGTIAYVEDLLDAINAQIAADGGYTYLVNGQGSITYDKAVANPFVGTEATQVTQMKGGSLRFANSKKPAFHDIDDWNWSTVITPDGFLGLAATIAAITTGFIGNSSGSSYMYLDGGELYLSNGSSANKLTTAVDDARKVATNYLSFIAGTGLDVGYQGTNAKTRINGSGMEVFDGNGVSALYAGLSGTNSIVRVGRASGSGNVVMSSEGYVDVRNASTIMAHFGYGNTIDEVGNTKVAPYYDIGIRKSGTNAGSWSVIEGNSTTASYACAHAEGDGTSATAFAAHAEGDGCTARTFASHAEGYNCVAGEYGAIPQLMEGTCHAEGIETKALKGGAHSEGSYTEASGFDSHAGGYYTIARGYAQTAIGRYNVAEGTGGYTDQLFIVGRGTSTSSRRNAFYVDYDGDIWCAGTLTQNSDRRLKEHHAYLGEDACDFIRALKPALYTKDGARHVGFYAQDVQAAEPKEWDTETVTAQHTDESLGFDPLTLDYNALIAPLVAYTQQLEKRIDEQQETIEALVKRIEALEGAAQ